MNNGKTFFDIILYNFPATRINIFTQDELFFSMKKNKFP